MKPHPFLRIFTAIAALALLCAPALAHQGEKHGAGEQAGAEHETGPIGVPAKEAGLVWKKLGRSEYLHVLLNPLPIYGSALGALALAAALILRSKEAKFVGLLIVLVAAGSALPVLLTGQNAYDRLHPDLSEEAQQWLELHMARAEFFIYVFYATALVAAGGLATWRRAPNAAAVLAKIALAGVIACAGLAVWIGHAGGQIMHSEVREGPPPLPSK